MGKYFNIKINPDIVNGDISNVIAANGTDAPFANNDVLFDWTKFEIPTSCKLTGITVVVNGEDGVAQTAKDIELIFAKDINNIAPTTIGVVNATATALNIQNHVIGGLTIDKENGVFGTDSCAIFSSSVGSADGGHSAIVLDSDPLTTGVQEVYIAGIATGAMDFSTGVLANAAVTAATAATATTGIVVKTVDPRLCFSVGDTVYIMDVDVPIGTVKALTDNDVILNAANVGAIAEDDELINANPFKITLHCEM
tara:strand:+ start:458 stop:1219 length:762 start_codon:yes stop_codon:yes gene_type:complete